MSPLDKEVLAEKTAAVERHLSRVRERLPTKASQLLPSTDAADVVILHLWQAVQIVIDIALTACVSNNLGTPTSYADAFRRLANANLLDEPLAERLVLATGFRNAIVNTYENLDMAKVYEAASKGPNDLRAFLATLRDQL
jgi:uncharacterized protein YutE (UPF0331/DUF86 family)